MTRNGWSTLLVGFVGGAVLFAFLDSSSASNQGSPAGGVAAIDIVYVFNEYQRQKDLASEMQQAQERIRAEDERRRAAIEGLEATLTAMDPADATFDEKRKELRNLTIDYKTWSEVMQADMAREVGVWTVRMYQEILEVVNETARREGYELVVYRDQFQPQSFEPEAVRRMIRDRKVVYVDPARDLTQRVLGELNQRYQAQPKQPMLELP